MKLYDETNDKVRIDTHQKLGDRHLDAALMTFFRHIDAPFVHQEQLAPAMDDGETVLLTAVRDRAWPPWGLGAKRIGAVGTVHRLGAQRFGIGPIHTSDGDRCNIGLIAAVYKEALDHIRKHEGSVAYLVVEGSVLADRVLRANGFEPSDDGVSTNETRYRYYQTGAAALAARLGLDGLSLPELLAHEIDDGIFQRFSTLILSVQAGFGSLRRDWRVPEILGVLAGIHWDTPPAQVPPPISRGPGRTLEIPDLARPGRGR